MRLPRFKKKFIAGALAAGVAMGAGGIAAAYFTASGSGNGYATIGTAGTITVSQNATANTTIYPGTTGKVSLKLANDTHGTSHYTINKSDVTVKKTATASTAVFKWTSTGNKYVVATGCAAAWFTVAGFGGTAATTVKGTLKKTATAKVTVTVKMIDTTVAQTACAGISGPELTVSF